MTTKLKQCRGCRHLRRQNNGHQCAIKCFFVDGYEDKLSGYRVSAKIEGFIPIIDMRSDEGECGPEGRLYETWTLAFFRWLNDLIN